VEQGFGVPVVLIHELGGSTETWRYLQPALRDAGFRVVALDLRGAGKSEVPSTPYSLSDLSADVVKVMDTLTIDRAFLIALAVGGFVALEAAVTRPERVRGLVLLDTPLFMTQAGASYSVRRASVVRERGMSEVVDESISRSFPSSGGPWPAQLVAAYREQYLANDPEGYALATEAILEADFRDRASQISAPALVLVGEHDVLFPPDRVRQLADALPAATYGVILRAGHFPPLQRPRAVQEHVIPFLHQRLAAESRQRTG
jgi:3-oxoadipate enol-lactonase